MFKEIERLSFIGESTKIYSHHLYEVENIEGVPVFDFFLAQKGLKFIFHSENCFSIKNKDDVFLTAFEGGDTKFYATKCNTWEKFYILDKASQTFINNSITHHFKDRIGNEITHYEIFFENDRFAVSLGASLFFPSYIPAAIVEKSNNAVTYKTHESQIILNKKRILVYFCIYGKQEYYDCFELAVTSLIKLGGYQGDILIKTDDLDKTKSIMNQFNNNCYYSLIDDYYGIFNRYWLHEDILINYDSIVYLDSDILTVSRVDRLFYEFAEKADFLAYVETDNRAYQKSEAARYTWWGADYLVSNQKIPTEAYFMYNSGFFVINNLKKVRSVFDRILEYRCLETHTGDQPWLNLALYNNQLEVYGIAKNYQLVFARNITQSHHALDKTWIHFNSGVGNLSKLNLMQKIYNRLI